MSHWWKPFFEPIMLDLIVKLLVIIFLPVSTVIIWQRWTRTTWVCLAIAFCAVSITALVRTPMDPVRDAYVIFYENNPLNLRAMWPYIVFVGIIYGVLKEGIRWLLIRFAVRTVWSWKEGVFFGICYSVLAIPLVLGMEIYNDLDLTAYRLWHPSQIIPHLNNDWLWRRLLHMAWDWSITLIVLDVGTSLAVLLSVRTRQLWPFLIAALSFPVVVTIPLYFAEYLRPVLEWAGAHPSLSINPAYYMMRFLVVMPLLWFTLHIRRIGALDS